MVQSKCDPFTVTIEPVKSCNLSCLHCYCKNTGSSPMAREELNHIQSSLLNFISQKGLKEIHFVWHGGEPLLAGVNFYKEAFAGIDRVFKNVKVRHFMQSNGLLIDQEFCDLFAQYQVDLGISLDGPRRFHDTLRVSSTGSGTFSDVFKTIDLLTGKNLSFGFCCVIRKQHLGHAEEVLHFFQELGKGVRMNPILCPPAHSDLAEFTLKPGEYGHFLSEIFDAWISIKLNRISVSPLESYLAALVNKRTDECMHQRSCLGKGVGIKPGTTCFLCSRFEEQSLGNLYENDLDSLFNSSMAREITERTDSLPECLNCRFKQICHSGCPYNAYIAYGTSHERDPFCADYRYIYHHLEKSIAPFINAGEGSGEYAEA